MADRTPRVPTIFVVVASIALAGCGSSGTKVCNESGCCGGNSDLCAAPQYVYADGTGGQVSVFTVDSGTGALGSPTSTSGPAMSLGMAELNNQFLYVSNSSASLTQPSSIDAWSIDLGTGALTPLPGSPFVLEPLSVASGLAVDSSTQVLYVGDAAKIDALKADPTGALTPIAGSPFPAGTNIFLTVDPLGRFVFASEVDPPGSVAAFTIDATSRALTAVAGSPFPAIPNSVANSRPGEIVVDSTGSFVYVALTGTNQVAAFSIVAPAGALSPVPGSPFPAGNSPLALVAVNNFLYVSNALGGSVSGYSIDPATGVLTPVAGSPFPISAAAFTSNLTGSILYVAGSGAMTAFKIDSATGALTQVGSGVPYPGATVLAFLQ
jgi:6-phosphogluconolactonase